MKLFPLAATIVVSTAAFAEPPKPTQALLDQGKAAFTTNCEACHGPSGEGDGPAGKVLTPHPRNFKTDPFKQGEKVEDVFKTLATGVPGTPMIGWSHLSEADRWALAFYVEELRKPGSVLNPPKATNTAKAPKAAKKK